MRSKHFIYLHRDGEGQETDAQIQRAMRPPAEHDALANLKLPKSPYRASWANQFSAMMRRSTIELIRDPALVLIKIMQAIVSTAPALHTYS